MKDYQVISSDGGVVIRDGVSFKTETTFATLPEALLHLGDLVDRHGAISVQIDTQRWASANG
jgi:hypothetical protein